MAGVVDALGRELSLARPARRVVSLVPSETESVAELAGLDVLVGRTDYCEEPEGGVERIPSVGGTKKFDPARVIELCPDLVLANKEENSRPLVEALLSAGLPVYVSFQKTVDDALSHLEILARLLGVDSGRSRAIQDAVEKVRRARNRPRHPPVRVFAPIWMSPLMTFDGRTFASDLLAVCGAENVFADRPRRYPLAADLGRAPPLAGEAVAERDTRYPRISVDEVVIRAPDAVLLPDEPHRFSEADAHVFRQLAPFSSRPESIVFVSGRDLFWSSTRLGRAVVRLTSAIAQVRA